MAIALASSAAAFLGVGAIGRIANIGGMTFALLFLTVTLGLLRLRRRMPDIGSPFRVPLGRVVASIAAIASAGMLLVSIWETRPGPSALVSVEWALFFGWGLVGLIAWFALKRIRESVSEDDRRHLILGEDPE
jgi:amino acid transporter